MSKLQDWMQQRQQNQRDSAQKVLMDQYKVHVPATKLKFTPKPSHNFSTHHRREIHSRQASKVGQNDAFDTDAECLNVTSVTSSEHAIHKSRCSIRDPAYLLSALHGQGQGAYDIDQLEVKSKVESEYDESCATGEEDYEEESIGKIDGDRPAATENESLNTDRVLLHSLHGTAFFPKPGELNNIADSSVRNECTSKKNNTETFPAFHISHFRAHRAEKDAGVPDVSTLASR